MRLIIAIAILFLVFNSSAQDSTAFSRLAITCKPLGAIDPFLANYTLGLEYQINKNLLAEINGGWIKTYLGSSTEHSENIYSTGYKVSAEVKYIVVKGLYVAVQAFYNDYDKTADEYVWRFAQTYQQKFKIHRLTTSIGGHLKAGYILKRPGKRFFYNFYAGIGVRQKQIKINNLPDDSELIDNNGNGVINNFPGNQVFPSVTLGVTIGFRL